MQPMPMEQSAYKQSLFKTGLDLLDSTVGGCFQIKHRDFTTIPVKITW